MSLYRAGACELEECVFTMTGKAHFAIACGENPDYSMGINSAHFKIAVAYQNRLLENLRGLKEIFPAEEYEVLSADRKELIREISHRVTSIKVLVREMTEARKVANHLENYKERAFAYEEKVRPYLDQIRDHIDHLEMEVDDEIWPLPKYRELLFTK